MKLYRDNIFDFRWTFLFD